MTAEPPKRGGPVFFDCAERSVLVLFVCVYGPAFPPEYVLPSVPGLCLQSLAAQPGDRLGQSHGQALLSLFRYECGEIDGTVTIFI